ncbi:bifunctional metallophosphatase/5'-nucleotidase [Opitutaceae bacterium]
MSLNSLCRLAVCAVLAVVSSLAAAERTRITFLSTTDLHGNIYPIDYYTNQPAHLGLAKVATLIQQVRREDPELILLDSGDTIQGTPLAYYHNRRNNTPRSPMMLVMSTLKYDALAIGNHEYNFGLGVLNKARREASFPWLSGNTYKVGTDETAFAPYLVKEVKGMRVGIIGLTTPGVPSWDNPGNYEGLEFRDPVASGRKWVQVLRETEKVDVVVIAMHMGIEVDLATGRLNPGQVPQENAAVQIAQEVPGIDVIFMGHTHRDVPALLVNGVLLSQANRWGDRVVRADVYVEKDATSGRWQVAAKSAVSLPVTATVAADPEILALAEPYHRETQAWLGTVIGEASTELTTTEGYYEDNALIDLIQRVQMEAGQADVSLAANFNLRARIAAGPVTVRDIAGLYIYENTLVVIEATGATVKAALEHSARFFRETDPDKSPRERIDPRVPGYNFDIAEGVEYEIDLQQPYGRRIRNLRFKGEPLAPDRVLRVAINNYRLNGGGGYTMYKDAKVLHRSSEEIRDLIIAWMEKNRQVPATPNNNWRILP